MKFNSREYEWADVSVVIGARSLTGIRGVQYSEAQEKEALYAKGRCSSPSWTSSKRRPAATYSPHRWTS